MSGPAHSSRPLSEADIVSGRGHLENGQMQERFWGRHHLLTQRTGVTTIFTEFGDRASAELI